MKLPVLYLYFALSCIIGSSHIRAREIVISAPQELQDSVNAAEPGDTIILSNGEWKDLHLIINRNGTENAPITIKAHTAGKAIITGSSRIAIGGSYVVIDGLHFKNAESILADDLKKHIGEQPKPDEEVFALVDFIGAPGKFASYSRLTNCYFESCNPKEQRRYHWVRLMGKHNRVDHCRFEGQDHRGVTVQVRLVEKDAEHRIDHNYFFDRKPATKNGYECIQIGQSWASMKRGGVVVENNIFEDCNGETEIISSKTGDNLIRQNVFLRSRGTLTIRHGNGTTAEGNLFLGDGNPEAGGIRVIGEDHTVTGNYFYKINSFTGGVIVLYCGIPDGPINGYAAAHRATISDNIILHSNGIPIYLNGGFGSRNRTILAEDVTIKNNTIVHPPRFGDVTIAGFLPSEIFSNNLYSGRELGRPKQEGFISKKLTLLESSDGLMSVVESKSGKVLVAPNLDTPTKSEVGPKWLNN